MKIWTNNRFEGHYPVGTAAVVIAEDAESAAEYLTPLLVEQGLPAAIASDMEQMPFIDGQVSILANGDY